MTLVEKYALRPDEIDRQSLVMVADSLDGRPVLDGLADGSVGSIGVGRVKIRYNGRDSVEYFLFGETGSVMLIGVETLQNLSLGVDPVNHRLIDIVPDA